MLPSRRDTAARRVVTIALIVGAVAGIPVTISGSTFSHNTAAGNDGAVTTNTLTIDSSTFVGNTVTDPTHFGATRLIAFNLFTSLAPCFIAGTLHGSSRFDAGAVTFAVFGSAAVAQVLTARMSVPVQFRSSVAVPASLATPQARGEVLAALFLIAYVGLAVPVPLVGLALVILPSGTVLVGFSAVVLVLAVTATLSMSRARG